MKVYLVWESWGDDVVGVFLTKDDAEKAVEMLNTARRGTHYFFEQYEVEDFKTFEARMNQDE